MSANEKSSPQPSNPAPRRRSFVPRRLPGASLAITVMLAPAVPACAQWIPCLPEQQDLVKIPELISKDGRLRGTLLLSDQQERLTFRQPPAKKPGEPGAKIQCAPQYVRVLRGVDAVPPPPAKAGDYPDPLPGPTLRVRVGDLIELTFLNQINPADFGNSIDRGDAATGTGCDESSNGYPGKIPPPGNVPPGGDTFPNCFHGSSTANVHFHGTHTNPSSTGDNVFIEVRPSLRVDGKPIVTEASVRESFDEFFCRCEAKLKFNPLRQWPYTWSDLPPSYTAMQKELLKKYDETPGIKKLWPVDEAQLEEGAWPQYYLGAYPYCFRLPEYTATTWPPPPAPAVAHAAAHAGGAGTAELAQLKEAEPARPLIMGQSPGTHWYHAHKHGSTAIDVSNGMTGALIIEGKYDDELNKFYGDGWTRRQPVMVINQIGVTPNLERGSKGRTDAGENFSINGRLNPLLRLKPGEVQMWRIVNTSFRSGAYFHPPQHGLHWMRLAVDGVQLKDVNYKHSLDQPFLLAAGNRTDLLVKAPTKPGAACKTPESCTYPIMVTVDVDPGDLAGPNKLDPVTLLSVNVAGTAPEMEFISPAPDFPPFLADISRAEVKGTKKIVFASNGATHTIDGRKFSGEVGEVVLLNTVEEWKVVNETYGPLISHPFHIHINPFQVVEVFSPNDLLLDESGKPVIDPATKQPVPKYTFAKAAFSGQCHLDPTDDPDNWKPCDPPHTQKDLIWWDVFPIPSGAQLPDPSDPEKDPKKQRKINVPGYFKMRSRFVDYSGYYVIHCHILAHEDRGMMTIVEVAPLRSPYSHH